MRSEKEILKQEAEDAYIDEFTYDGDVESIYEAMKINAKETSIEFFKFMSPMLDIHEYELIEKRYNLFIKSIEK